MMGNWWGNGQWRGDGIGMMGGWAFGIGSLLWIVTSILVIAVLVALFRYLWKKGDREK